MHDLVIFETNPLAVKVTQRLPALLSKCKAFGKKNSQVSSSLMSLNMVDSGPYRVLRQILAQITKKNEALKEAAFRHEKKLLRLEEIDVELGYATSSVESKRLKLRKKKIQSDIADSKMYIDAAIKELGAYQDRYYQILETKGIPEDWTEDDFERAEIKHHIVQMFKNAIRDRMNGGVNYGTMEYMEQFGIEPVVAYRLVDAFLVKIHGCINETDAPSIESRYEFYDEVYEVFKEEYKKALDRIGLKQMIFEDWT